MLAACDRLKSMNKKLQRLNPFRVYRKRDERKNTLSYTNGEMEGNQWYSGTMTVDMIYSMLQEYGSERVVSEIDTSVNSAKKLAIFFVWASKLT